MPVIIDGLKDTVTKDVLILDYPNFLTDTEDTEQMVRRDISRTVGNTILGNDKRSALDGLDW